MRKFKVLVIGASGMLGHAVFRLLRQSSGLDVVGTIRNASVLHFFSDAEREHLVPNVDVLDSDRLVGVFGQEKPSVVINCAGLVKQLSSVKDPLVALPINSLFPHRLARLCDIARSRLIHISTDCVFSGKKGSYVEHDPADALDVYGRSKHMGETIDYPHAVTLRTSIIGRELASTHSLVDWFLSQEQPVSGFSRAVFSGLPTNELARVIRDVVLPRTDLNGLYHVSSSPISKLNLLRLIADAYGKTIEIRSVDKPAIDRSLDSSLFRSVTGYTAPDWHQLITQMHYFDTEGGNRCSTEKRL